MRLTKASLALAGIVALAGTSILAEQAYQYFRTGKSANVAAHPSPGFLLAGGGKTPDEAYRWFVRKARGGDAITLRASGADAMNTALMGAGGLNSASTLLFKDRTAAEDRFVIKQIDNAAALFIAGGDQWNYVRMWKGTAVNEAIQRLIDKGAPAGGSSAGLAVLGEFSFSAEHGSITSKEALANPLDERVTIASGFIRIPILKGVITDTHFVKRDRLGRLLVFLARILADGKARPISGVAVDEGNALLIEPDGSARLFGAGTAYFIRATEPAQVCEAGKPLTFRNVTVYRIDNSGSFNLKSWRGQQGAAYGLSVEEGTVKSTQAGGAIY